MQELGTDKSRTESTPIDEVPPSLERVLSALHTLKTQHATLLKSMQGLTFESNPSSVQGSPLPFTAEEEEQTDDSQISPWLTTAMSRKTQRSSVSTTVSDSVHEWFDALDGAEEFVMDVHTTPDGNEQPSRMLTNESRSSLDQHDISSIDTDENLNVPTSEDTRTASPHSIQQVVRRTRLSAPPSGDEGSLFAILKKNVGKVYCFVL